MNDEFSSKYRATAISALSMLTGIVYITITIISGPIMQWGGGVKSMYTLLGIAALIFIAPLAVKLIQLQTQEDALDAATHLH